MDLKNTWSRMKCSDMINYISSDNNYDNNSKILTQKEDRECVRCVLNQNMVRMDNFHIYTCKNCCKHFSSKNSLRIHKKTAQFCKTLVKNNQAED